MKSAQFKTKKDLIGTVKKIGETEYLRYDEDYDDFYNVTRISYINGRKCEKKIYFQYDFDTRIVGQYEISDDYIIFKVEMPTDDYGRYNAHYPCYSIKKDKIIKIPNKLEKLGCYVVDISELDKKENEEKNVVFHLRTYGPIESRLEKNPVDFFAEVPSFKILPNAYSSLRNNIIETNDFADIRKLIDEDVEYEQIIDSFKEVMNFNSENSKDQILLLKK